MKKERPSRRREPSPKRVTEELSLRPATPAARRSVPWNAVLRTVFSIDPRSLAAFRMAIGVLLLVDLAIRATDLGVMYTDAGMFSRAEISQRVTTVWNWSFHFGGGAWPYQAFLFGIAALMAAALLAGFETRLAAIGSWLMLVSLHHRVPPILSGADLLLRLLLLWGLFLPLGRVWSVDHWLRQRRGSSDGSEYDPVFSVASAGILLQMAWMYLFSAIFKSNPAWFRGETLAGVMAHDFYASPRGAYLLHFPRLLMGLTWGTLVLEWAAPLLLFIPKWTAKVRMALVAALAALHISIALCLEVDLFSFVSIAGLILFLPAEFWQSRLFARFASARISTPAPSAAITPPFARPRTPLFYLQEGAALALLLFILAVNVNHLPSHPLAPLEPEKWKPLITGGALGQKWAMFEDVPSRSGWYVARARLRDGSDVDLLREGAAVDWKKPGFPASIYPNFRWRKVFREMAYEDELGYQVFREPIARYLCRAWDSRHAPDQQVTEFEFIYCMETEVKAPGAPSLHTTVRQKLVHLQWGEEDEGWAAVATP